MVFFSVRLIVEKAGLSNDVDPLHLVVEASEANGWLPQDDSRIPNPNPNHSLPSIAWRSSVLCANWPLVLRSKESLWHSYMHVHV